MSHVRRLLTWQALVALLALLLATFVGVRELTTSSSPDHGSAAGPTTSVASVDQVARPNLSPAQLRAWRRDTRTAADRARLVADLRRAFAGVGVVGTGPMPSHSSAPAGALNTAYEASEPDLAYGVTGDHVWVIVSYADVAHGAVSVAVHYCDRYAPGWLCSSVGNQLDSWASGWGAASNHGVWAAAYWWPPHFTGGRW